MYLNYKKFRSINLEEYAIKNGFVLNKNRSSSKGKCYDLLGGWKIIIYNNGPKGYYYTTDCGTYKGDILSFYSNILGHEMITAEGKKTFLESINNFSFAIEKKEEKRAPIKDFSTFLFPLKDLFYLTEKRKINKEVISSSRFSERILSDKYANTCFPFYYYYYGENKTIISGYNMRNSNISNLIAKGSNKDGFWHSNLLEGDCKAVFTEAPIDAISIDQIYKPKNTLYVSSCGNFSSLQVKNIRYFLLSNNIKEVIFGLDRGEKGSEEIGLVKRLEKGLGSFILVKKIFPKKKDFNEDLISYHDR